MDGLSLPAGKLSPALLHEMIGLLPTSDPDLVLGPGLGEDAAVIRAPDAGQHLSGIKSDPITFATDHIAHYAVHVCANDLAVTGARPKYFLPVMLFPARGTTASMVQELFRQLGAVCQTLGIVVAGGHTEITEAVNQPVVSGTMLGTVPAHQVVSSGGAEPGDRILLAGQLPLEAISLIAREKRDVLRRRGYAEAELARAAGYLFDPGISILAPALQAASLQLVTAMHDPTEGGLMTALAELAHASQVGLSVDLQAPPIPAIGQRLCREFGLDPLGAIASGCLLATARPDRAHHLAQTWRALGWPVSILGETTSRAEGLRVFEGETEKPWPHFAADEITRLFHAA